MFQVTNFGSNSNTKLNGFNRQSNTSFHSVPLKSDSVSFGCKEKIVNYGSDAVLDAIRRCADLLGEGKGVVVTDAVSLIRAGAKE